MRRRTGPPWAQSGCWASPHWVILKRFLQGAGCPPSPHTCQGRGPRRALTCSELTAALPAEGLPAESVQGSALRAPPSLGCTELLRSRLR